MAEAGENAGERAVAVAVEVRHEGQVETGRALVGIDPDSRDLRRQPGGDMGGERAAAEDKPRLVGPHAARQAAGEDQARERVSRHACAHPWAASWRRRRFSRWKV